VQQFNAVGFLPEFLGFKATLLLRRQSANRHIDVDVEIRTLKDAPTCLSSGPLAASVKMASLFLRLTASFSTRAARIRAF
jgi:hypothetical protein